MEISCVFLPGYAPRIGHIRAGSNNTFAVGEWAGGLSVMDVDVRRPSSACERVPGQQFLDDGSVGNTITESMDILTGGIWACTLDLLSKNPVTDTFIDLATVGACLCNLNGGTRSVANSRSDHPGGGNFLLAGGSAQFVSQSIEMMTYQRLSTVAERANASVP